MIKLLFFIVVCIVALSHCVTHFYSHDDSKVHGNAALPKLAPWTPIDWTTIPPALDDDQVEVIYLLCPLLEEDYGDWLGYIGLHHGAIAFRNVRTGYEITINYDAFNFIRSSVFPVIVNNPNGTQDLDWINGGASFIYEGINETYWTTAQYLVSVINGTLFNNYLSKFNSQINDTYPYYNMFSITPQFGAQSYVPSWDCFDFVWASFNFLYESGASLNYTLNLKRNFVNIYSTAPLDYTDLYENDPNIKQEVVDFFAFIQANESVLSWEEFFAALFSIFDGVFYVRHSTQYYKAQLQFPYFGSDFAQQLLPGQQS